MNIEQIKNTLREFQAENRQKFKNTQAEFKKAVSCKKNVYLTLTGMSRTKQFKNESNDRTNLCLVTAFR